MTIEELLRTKVIVRDNIEMSPDFRVAVQNIGDDGVHFIIHPMNFDGDTLDYICNGDKIVPKLP